MEWKEYNKQQLPKAFTESLKNEHGKYNLMERLTSYIKEGIYESYYIAAVYKNRKIVAHIVHTPPFPIQIAVLENDQAIIHFIADHFREYENINMGIAGEQNTTKQIASKLYDKWFEKDREGVFVCHEVTNEFQQVHGQPEIPQQEHFSLLKDWYQKSTIEMNLEIELNHKTEKEKNDMINEWIEKEAGQFLIYNDVPVSFVKYAKVGDYFSHIGNVYTPKEYRKNGYAARNVALLTKKLLEKFEYTTLYTDLNNPTSNKIYKEIGYKQVAEFSKILPG
nr:GNAT family N-acetyltransferase [Mammaliicoccus sp. Marseille-Q6498]